MASRHTIGVDLGDKFSHFCVLNEKGAVAQEGRVPTTPSGMQRQLGRWPAASSIVIEVGTHSRWISEAIVAAGHSVIVANPRRLKLITESMNKNDRADAHLLARLARADIELLAPIQHRSREMQAALAIVRARDTLVRTRVQLVNCVRGLVKPFGIRLMACSTDCFAVKNSPNIPDDLRAALAPLLSQIDSLTETVWAYDAELEHLALTRYPESRRLKQVAGVGTLSALTFMFCIGDPARFARSRDVGCYLGLKPKKKQSGERNPELGISKSGNELLRRTLVQSAHYILGHFGPDTDLRRWGLKLAGQGKAAKKRALTAVARKLAVLLHRLWVSGESYIPLRACEEPPSPVAA